MEDGGEFVNFYHLLEIPDDASEEGTRLGEREREEKVLNFFYFFFLNRYSSCPSTHL